MNVIAGRHCSRNGSESEEGCRKVIWIVVWQSRRSTKVKACWWQLWLLKFARGESKKAERVENDTIGVLYRIWPKRSGAMRLFWNERLQHGEQNRNFGIKWFLSQNWEVCVYTKIWEEERVNSKLPELCHQGIDWMRIGINWFRCNVRIGYFMDDVSRRRQWAILEWR